MRLYLLLLFIFSVGSSWAQPADSTYTGFPESQVLTADSAVVRFLEESGVPITYNNSVKILPSGKDKFEDLFHAISLAKHHVHMEYFNFRNDSLAAKLFEYLAIKAEEGVEIRLIFDAFGNCSNSKPLKKKHLKIIRDEGIEIVKFDPLKFPYLHHIFHRDHRKIVVIDGKVAYTGGMNVADYYIDGLPKIGLWRDMHLRLEGGAVEHLQDIFLTIWNKQTKQNIGGEAYYPEQEENENNGQSVAIVDRVPRESPKLLRRTMVKSILSARDKIQIVNPYFVPTKSVRKSLDKAIKQGVNVEIMISAKSDIHFTPDASYHVVHKLMKKGASIYLYNKGFHHSKIMMIDDSFCTVGSTNFDSRSLRFDYETNAFIFDKDVTQKLTEIFENDKKDSTLMTPENWKQRSRWKRFVGWFAHLFTPFL